jgi:hypothetical protein
MNTEEAIRIAKIMVNPKLRGTTRIVELLVQFDGLDLTRFFNGMKGHFTEREGNFDKSARDYILWELDRRKWKA